MREQLNKMTNKMNGGYARWQSQYLRKLRVPTLSDIPEKLTSSMLSCYKNRNIEGINYYTCEILTHEKDNPSKLNVRPKKKSCLTNTLAI